MKLDARPEYIRATLQQQLSDNIPLAIITGSNQLSSRLSSTRGANLLLRMPKRQTDGDMLHAGDIVDALVIAPL